MYACMCIVLYIFIHFACSLTRYTQPNLPRPRGLPMSKFVSFHSLLSLSELEAAAEVLVVETVVVVVAEVSGRPILEGRAISISWFSMNYYLRGRRGGGGGVK